MKAEQEWERAQRCVLRASIPVNQHVDPDRANDNSAYKICLWGKPHDATTLFRSGSRYVGLKSDLVAQFQAADL
jgi:hypothetical protein